MKGYKKVLLSILIVSFLLNISACSGPSSESASTSNETKDPNRTIVVGIAWKCDNKPKVYESAIRGIEDAGGKAVVLGKVTSLELAYNEEGTLTDSMIDVDGDLSDDAAEIVKGINYDKTNVGDTAAGIDAIIFLGGEDISPSLFKVPEAVDNGSDPKDTINPTRDVSDYILMNYCLDNDIPIMGICRGMQMLAIISGGRLIQDIPSYYEEKGVEYDYYHRMERDSKGEVPDFIPHNVDIIDEDSIIYGITGSNILENVPSWHHQGVDVNGVSSIRVTGTTSDHGVIIPEIIERIDKSYVIGYQFHPEAIIEKSIKQENVFDFTSIITINSMFESLIENAR